MRVSFLAGTLLLGAFAVNLAAQIASTPEQIAAELQARIDARMPHMAPGVTERGITFKTTDGLTLPGTLTLPKAELPPPVPPGEAPKPAPKPPVAVLVQGSGVQDRDATTGPNKFFQQLAWGLAARGVAVLRYDRRAKVAPDDFFQHADLDHEVVMDAAAALAFAKTLSDIDGRRVFLVGHSLGAQLAPDTAALRLTEQPGSVQGMVLLSGIARPIDVVIDEQIRALGKNQGATPEQLNQIAGMWADVFKQAKDPASPAETRIGMGTQLPVKYWRDWLRRDPVAAMRTLRIPVLVTRGTRDVNAPHADFELLKAASSAKGSAAREFAGLNQLYMLLAGEPNGSDVMTPGTVSAEFLDYLAAWLRATAAEDTTASDKMAAPKSAPAQR